MECSKISSEVNLLLSSIVLLLCTIFSSNVFGQNTFREYHQLLQSASEADLLTYRDNLKETNANEALVYLLSETKWEISDLYIFDNNKKYGSPIQKAIFYFAYGNAYADYDQYLSDSLHMISYSMFRELNDYDGLIFCGMAIFQNSFVQNGLEISNRLKSIILEINDSKNKTNYPYSILKATIVWYDYLQLKNITLSESSLDSFALYVEKLQHIDTAEMCTINTALAIQYYAGGRITDALKLAIEAHKLSVLSNQYVYAYKFNLGFLYSNIGEIDSALFYLHSAKSLTPGKNILYFLKIQKSIMEELSYVYKSLNQLDSALFYSEKGAEFYKDIAQFELNQARVYADKKFETAQHKAKSIQLENDLNRRKNERALFIVALILLVFFAFTLLVFMAKRKKVILKNKELATKREQLVQVISHDLSGAIHALITYVEIYNEAKKNMSVNEFIKIENSFVASAKSIQTTLQQITYWGKGLRGLHNLDSQFLNFDSYLLEILATYAELAAIRGIKINSNSKVGDVFINSEDLGTIIRTLIYNAITHTHNSSNITIDAIIKDRNIVLEVSNFCDQNDKLFLLEVIPTLHLIEYISPNGRLGLELMSIALKNLKAEVLLKDSKSEIACIVVKIPSI